jgi:hypothetical protein
VQFHAASVLDIAQSAMSNIATYWLDTSCDYRNTAAMSTEYLDPAKTVIERLGGVDKVSEITGKHRTRVFRWMYPQTRGGTGGLIPQRQIPLLLDFANKNKICLAPSDFITTRAASNK